MCPSIFGVVGDGHGLFSLVLAVVGPVCAGFIVVVASGGVAGGLGVVVAVGGDGAVWLASLSLSLLLIAPETDA